MVIIFNNNIQECIELAISFWLRDTVNFLGNALTVCVLPRTKRLIRQPIRA